jgi:pantetheine-phosphate adenylyltransferase
MRICLFPGSFDPITLGHVNIIERAVGLFDKLVIGIGSNSAKQSMFSVAQRIDWMNAIFADNAKIEAAAYEGLTIDFCRKINAQYILRGIRYVNDFEYERAIADMNHSLAPEIETIFLTSATEHASISSTLVRDVIRNGGDARQFLPKEVRY